MGEDESDARFGAAVAGSADCPDRVCGVGARVAGNRRGEERRENSQAANTRTGHHSVTSIQAAGTGLPLCIFRASAVYRGSLQLHGCCFAFGSALDRTRLKKSLIPAVGLLIQGRSGGPGTHRYGLGCGQERGATGLKHEASTFDPGATLQAVVWEAAHAISLHAFLKAPPRIGFNLRTLVGPQCLGSDRR